MITGMARVATALLVAARLLAAGAAVAAPALVAPMGGGTRMNDISLQFAGYDGDARRLAAEVDRYVAGAKQSPLAENPAALIVPHAGYVYSGPVAAYAYRAIHGKRYDTVVIVGPSHRHPFRGISVVREAMIETPLGIIKVDAELTTALLTAHREISWRPPAHAQEHSVEVQLPFLQRVLGEFRLVMAVVGSWSPEGEAAFVKTLVEAGKNGKRILLVASSDLSHYHDYGEARKLDGHALDLIKGMKGEALLSESQEGSCELCGLLPVHLAMELAEATGNGRVEVLNAANSGDTAGPKNEVVGYASVAFLPGKCTGQAKGDEGMLDAARRRRLLEIARQTIAANVAGKGMPPIDEKDQSLQTRSGAFVTIEKHGQLRGCIGTFTSDQPLWRTIMEMAVAASTGDPRFPPMTAGEEKDVELEISVLTPMRRITDVFEIEVGRHGLYIRKGAQAGTLLPQVATDYGWDRVTFLQQTCRKAGLPADAWKEGAEIYLYAAEVFNERELRH
jgi:AmmeMemoRadiSam system protein B/AmmeMemoRadiSam system protein A